MAGRLRRVRPPSQAAVARLDLGSGSVEPFHARSPDPVLWRESVDGKRYLVVTADDYGIGLATSQAILDLAVQGRVSCAVLLVNGPYAEDAVRAWRRAGEPLELGWHP